MNGLAAAILADAAAAFRRDRDLLLRVGAPFLFLPAFALALLVPAPPALPPETGDDATRAQRWAEALVAWTGAHGGWYLLSYVIGLVGVATLYALTLDRDRPDAGAAIARGAAATPRLVLALVLTALPVLAALSLWIVPGVYVMGRLILTGPAIVAERPLGAAAAILASIRRTRGQGLQAMTALAVPLGLGWLAGQPFLLLDAWLRSAGRLNPIVLAMTDAGAALVTLLAGIAQALVAAAAYRRLASSGT